MKSDSQQFNPDFKGQSWEEQQHGIVTKEASDVKTKKYKESSKKPVIGFGAGFNPE